MIRFITWMLGCAAVVVAGIVSEQPALVYAGLGAAVLVMLWGPSEP